MPAKFFRLQSSLQAQLDEVLEKTWQAFPNLAQNQIALTWIAYEPPYRVNTGGGLSAEAFWQYQPQGASYRGVELMDPVCIAHLFYVVAMQVWLEQGMVQPSPEITRAMVDVMTRNSHDGASFLLDVLTGTTSGPTLPAGPDETWAAQRNIVNRYFANLGWPELRSINLNQKTWCDRPYGREQAFLGQHLENRNQLTTEAIARLLHSIVGGVSVSSVRSQAMMDMLAQAPSESGPLSACHAYLPAGAKVWANACMTAEVGHSVSYTEADGVHPYLLILLTAAGSSGTKRYYSQLPAHEQALKARAQNIALVSFVSEQIFQISCKNFEVTAEPINGDLPADETMHVDPAKNT